MKGSEFKKIRECLGLTQEQLAQVLCLSGKRAVGNIETEFRKPGSLLVALMKVFSKLSVSKSKELQELLIANNPGLKTPKKGLK